MNIETGCEGTGLCNTGCGNERKRNGFQVYLPDAIQNGCVLVPNGPGLGIEIDANEIQALVQPKATVQ